MDRWNVHEIIKHVAIGILVDSDFILCERCVHRPPEHPFSHMSIRTNERSGEQSLVFFSFRRQVWSDIFITSTYTPRTGQDAGAAVQDVSEG